MNGEIMGDFQSSLFVFSKYSKITIYTLIKN